MVRTRRVCASSVGSVAASLQRQIVIVDRPEQLLVIEFKRAEVVLAVWVVGVAEALERLDRRDGAAGERNAVGEDAARDHNRAPPAASPDRRGRRR